MHYLYCQNNACRAEFTCDGNDHCDVCGWRDTEDQSSEVESLQVQIADLEARLATAVSEGWPTDEMVIRGAEALHGALLSNGLDIDWDHDLRGTERQQAIAESVFEAMLAVAPQQGVSDDD